MTFTSDIAKFVKTTENRLRTTVIEAVADLAGKIVKGTPIDAPPHWSEDDLDNIGEARGGWFITFNGNSTRETGRLDPQGDATIAQIRSGLKSYLIKTHRSIHLNNNVSYIGVLEFGGYGEFVNRLKSTAEGYSTQAPAGMARVNMFLWPTIVTKVVATSRMIK